MQTPLWLAQGQILMVPVARKENNASEICIVTEPTGTCNFGPSAWASLVDALTVIQFVQTNRIVKTKPPLQVTRFSRDTLHLSVIASLPGLNFSLTLEIQFIFDCRQRFACSIERSTALYLNLTTWTIVRSLFPLLVAGTGAYGLLDREIKPRSVNVYQE